MNKSPTPESSDEAKAEQNEKECPSCKGFGNHNMKDQPNMMCFVCNGTGKVPAVSTKDDASRCDSSGMDDETVLSIDRDFWKSEADRFSEACGKLAQENIQLRNGLKYSVEVMDTNLNMEHDAQFKYYKRMVQADK